MTSPQLPDAKEEITWKDNYGRLFCTTLRLNLFVGIIPYDDFFMCAKGNESVLYNRLALHINCLFHSLLLSKIVQSCKESIFSSNLYCRAYKQPSMCIRLRIYKSQRKYKLQSIRRGNGCTKPQKRDVGWEILNLRCSNGFRHFWLA